MRRTGWLRRSRAAWLCLPFALYSVLRIPSFLEPHWYTDEAGYAATARSLLQGRRLYSQIWTNKPPLQPWTIAADLAAFGSSEPALHAVTFLSGLATLAAVAYVGRALLGRWGTLVAMVVVAVALGTPLFDAELAIPESLLIAPAAWAGAIVLRKVCAPQIAGSLRWPVAAGACAAAAMAYQQTALADAAALGLILVVSPRVRPRQVVAYAATVAGITTAWLAAAVITAGAGTVAFALAGFYVAYTAPMLPQTGGGLAAHALMLLLCLGLIVGGAIAARRSDSGHWAPWVWAGATLMVAAAAQQPYAHFLAASVVPATLAVVSLRVPAWAAIRSMGRVWGSRGGTRTASVSGASTVAVGAAGAATSAGEPVARHRPRVRVIAGHLALVAGVAIAGVSARIAGVDWMPNLSTGSANTTRYLGDYYGGAVAVATGGSTLAEWQEAFDARVAGDRQMAAWVHDHGLSQRSAVVWSSDAWPYLMADLDVLMPTAPIYNNEVLLGNTGQVAVEVASLDPDIVITSDDSLNGFPEVEPLLATRYHAVDREGWDTVWLRNDQSVQASPG